MSSREWRLGLPDISAYDRRKNLQRFGLTPAAWDAMFEAQAGVCALCALPNMDRRLVIDHDHSCCGRNRACESCRRLLLCDRCNLMLGKAQDDPTLLRKAADYLERFR